MVNCFYKSLTNLLVVIKNTEVKLWAVGKF